MNIELCCECDQPTGRAGRLEDSMFIIVNDFERDDYKELGPFCQDCYTAKIIELGMEATK